MLDDFIFNDGECQINICGVAKVLGQKENNDIENNQFEVFSLYQVKSLRIIPEINPKSLISVKIRVNFSRIALSNRQKIYSLANIRANEMSFHPKLTFLVGDFQRVVFCMNKTVRKSTEFESILLEIFSLASFFKYKYFFQKPKILFQRRKSF